MAGADLRRMLLDSLRRQEELLRTSILLNPVENVPFADDIAPSASALHGLYNSDKIRTAAERRETNLQFSGRQALEADSRAIYAAWAHALHASDATLRLLSGLHAHIVLFMAIAQPGETVLLLPTEAGGHTSGRAILDRLGLRVTEMVVDRKNMRVDAQKTLALCSDGPPNYVFVDRSEGLIYEDFKFIAGLATTATIFDASQYLSNILAGDQPNPFDWGFDIVVATTHKNFPGPQKALLATREDGEPWRRVLAGVSTYVSNMHVTSTYSAGLTLGRTDWIKDYSRRMLEIATSLERELAANDVPVVRRERNLTPTHHLWIKESTKEAAFETYERLERAGIMTNFRKLPYGIGFGLRLGTNAIARLGFSAEEVPLIARLLAEVRRNGPQPMLVAEVRALADQLWSQSL